MSEDRNGDAQEREPNDQVDQVDQAPDTNQAPAAPPPDVYSMSDEELLRVDVDSLPETPADDDQPRGRAEPDAAEKEAAAAERAAPDGEPDDGDAGAGDDAEPASGDADAQQAGGAGSGSKPTGESKKSSDEPTDFEAQYKALLAPLKASGASFDIRSVDEARELMSKGMHFTKKMQQMKPGMKQLKLLDEAGIKGPDDLGYLLDLHRKDPKAIAKLLKDSNLDPLDIDTEEGARDYRPSARTVSDTELDLDAAIDAIQDSPTYAKTIGIVGRQWDNASKQAIGNEPALIGIINDHVASGIYDAINAEVVRQRTLGKLTGVTDLDAYQSIGNQLDADGTLAAVLSKDNPTGRDGAPGEGSAAGTERGSGGGKAGSMSNLGGSIGGTGSANEAREKARRAAGAAPSKGSASGGTPTGVNPLSLSDEEFMKQYGNELNF